MQVLSKAESQGILKGFCITRDATPITHLLFANDCLIFTPSKASRRFSRPLKNFWGTNSSTTDVSSYISSHTLNIYALQKDNVAWQSPPAKLSSGQSEDADLKANTSWNHQQLIEHIRYLLTLFDNILLVHAYRIESCMY
uniref:Uncharacterized protein n=1 Tax=Nelumbo nucifera TaxID=4432 RepID=A0A822XNE8_NELNU|nr:TPA_asm: hypothetical protein HUJ06_022032 [Nelumbo nucifera]